MFNYFRKKRIAEYTSKVSVFLRQTYIPEAPKAKPVDPPAPKPVTDSGVRHSRKTTGSENRSTIKYSIEESPAEEPLSLDDRFSTTAVATVMHKYKTEPSTDTLIKELEKTTNKTFVDVLIAHINKKGLRDSEVYKAAQIDRRLFSKIMSDRQYKPSKDTAIAIALALRLTLSETTDLLSRATLIGIITNMMMPSLL